MNIEQHRENIRSMIERNGSKIFSVNFIKKDGKDRTMLCHAAIVRDLVGDDALPQHIAMVATRKINNPHLMNVVDVNAYNKGIPARRSLNLDTVQWIKFAGVKYDVAYKDAA